MRALLIFWNSEAHFRAGNGGIERLLFLLLEELGGGRAVVAQRVFFLFDLQDVVMASARGKIPACRLIRQISNSLQNKELTWSEPGTKLVTNCIL